MYHINPTTKNPNICKKDNCALKHYKSKEAAKVAQNKVDADFGSAPIIKKTSVAKGSAKKKDKPQLNNSDTSNANKTAVSNIKGKASSSKNDVHSKPAAKITKKVSIHSLNEPTGTETELFTNGSNGKENLHKPSKTSSKSGNKSNKTPPTELTDKLALLTEVVENMRPTNNNSNKNKDNKVDTVEMSAPKTPFEKIESNNNNKAALGEFLGFTKNDVIKTAQTIKNKKPSILKKKEKEFDKAKDEVLDAVDNLLEKAAALRQKANEVQKESLEYVVIAMDNTKNSLIDGLQSRSSYFGKIARDVTKKTKGKKKKKN